MPARCPLLGYTPRQLQIEGRMVPNWFLQVETQPEVGEAAYDQGAETLRQFFLSCLANYDAPDLAPRVEGLSNAVSTVATCMTTKD